MAMFLSRSQDCGAEGVLAAGQPVEPLSPFEGRLSHRVCLSPKRAIQSGPPGAALRQQDVFAGLLASRSPVSITSLSAPTVAKVGVQPESSTIAA